MKIDKSESEWEDELTPEQYYVLREKGTEPAFSGELYQNHDAGDYRCGACGNLIFTSEQKYDSDTPGLEGWPSFSDAVEGSVEFVPDDSLGMSRTEAICSNCGSHLGHLFEDSTSPTGQHYCINSLSLKFDPSN
jgi:peptide-methionine (R)-S-oxide reductase